jgi:DNA-binding transcriptional MocR family regulator
MVWSPQLSGSGTPIYRAIADALAADIAAGLLRPGEKLPTQRMLAARLGIDLTTVTRAYAEAASRGLVISEGRRGSFVRGSLPGDASQMVAGETTSGMNMPPEPADSLLRDQMLAGMKTLLETRLAPLHYPAAGGGEAAREAAASYLGRNMAGISPDAVVITAGSQNGLHAVMSTAIAPGDRIAAARFTYPGLISLARRRGAELVALAMDEEGILPDALAKAAKGGGLRALYVVPTNDNPTTATLGESRRREIAALARTFGFLIIEDDAYGGLARTPLAPIASLAPELTWHLTTMSKLISPSLRIGFLRAPSIRNAAAAAEAVHETAIMAPPLNVALVTMWLADGSFQRILAAVRAEAEARMEEAVATLAPLGARSQPDGYHLWLPLDANADPDRTAIQAIAAGLPVAPSTSFALDPSAAQPALRISLGGSATRQQVGRSIRRLEAMIANASGGRGSFV